MKEKKQADGGEVKFGWTGKGRGSGEERDVGFSEEHDFNGDVFPWLLQGVGSSGVLMGLLGTNTEEHGD